PGNGSEHRGRIPFVEGTPRYEMDGGLLAFTQPATPSPGTDVLYAYDAGKPEPGPFPVGDDSHAFFFLFRQGNMGLSNLRTLPVALDVHDGRIAFNAFEAAMGEDLTGNGDLGDLALLVFDLRSGAVTNLHTCAFQLRLSSRWLTYQTFQVNAALGEFRLSQA